MRARWATVIVAGGLALLATACDLSPFTPDRVARIEAVRLEAEVRPDGVVAVHMVATFADDTGGILPIPQPLLTTTRDILVNGEAVTGAADFETINVPVSGEQVDATYVLDGLVQNYPDGTTVEVPVFSEPSDGSRQDPAVRVEGTLTLPAGAAGGTAIEAQWNGGLDRFVRVDGATITFTGRTPMWTGSELALSLPPGLTPGAPSAIFPGGFAQWRRQQADREVANRQLESTLNQQEIELTVANAVVVGFGVLVGILVLTGFVRASRSGRSERARLLAAAPDQLSEPPDNLDPALVAVLAGEARALDQDAVAGTILHLAHRGVVAIEGLPGGMFQLHVPAAAVGETSTETIVLDALRGLPAGDAGLLTGPPLWNQRRPAWWRSFRRDAFRRARAMNLIERRYRLLFFGPFAAILPCITWPFWAADKMWLVPVLLVGLGILSVIPLGGWRLSAHAYSSLGRWLAFARYTRDTGNLADVGAPGIVVWGPYLAYGAVLGVAPRAAADLAPTGGREGRARRDITRASAE